jgi:hypothetical protein
VASKSPGCRCRGAIRVGQKHDQTAAPFPAQSGFHGQVGDKFDSTGATASPKASRSISDLVSEALKDWLTKSEVHGVTLHTIFGNGTHDRSGNGEKDPGGKVRKIFGG